MRERTIQLDETDWRIIRALRENARATFTEIGRTVGLTSPAARERVRRMEEAGLIEGYRPVFNYSVMGFGIKAIILMKSKSDSRVAEKHYFRLLPAVRELEGIVRVGRDWRRRLHSGGRRAFDEGAGRASRQAAPPRASHDDLYSFRGHRRASGLSAGGRKAAHVDAAA